MVELCKSIIGMALEMPVFTSTTVSLKKKKKKKKVESRMRLQNSNLKTEAENFRWKRYRKVGKSLKQMFFPRLNRKRKLKIRIPKIKKKWFLVSTFTFYIGFGASNGTKEGEGHNVPKVMESFS